MALLGAVAKIGAGMLKGRKKKQTGGEVASKVTGGSYSVKANPNATNSELDAKKIVPAATSAQNISKSQGSGTTSLKESALRIKVTTIEVNTLLKGSLVLDKMRAKNKKETREELKRTKAENQLEADNKGKFSFPIPGAKKVKSFWERIKTFFLTIFVGMIGMKLLPLLPHLMKALPLIAKAADFMIDVGIWLVDSLATAIKWGYDAYDWTRNQVKEKLGEGAAKKFDSFAGTLNKMMNLVLTLGMAAAAAAGQRDKPPKRPKGKRPKWQRKLQEKWKRSKPGKLVRNTKARILKTRRAITQAVKNPKQALKNLQKTQAGKKVTEIAKKIDPRKWKMPQLKTPGWMKNLGGAIKKRTLGAIDWVKSIPAKTRQLWDDVAKKMGPYIDEIGEGVAKAGKSIGSKWTEITENMKPQKVIDDLMAKIRPTIDDILKKNPIIGKVANKLKPKNAKGAIQGLLTKAANNPALQKIINTLKANKGASKGLGPVDKIITALTALADYSLFKESPINAILKGLGGLLGYGVGFSAATAVPVLGQSGVFNFMGGMAGGIAGEWLAMQTAKLLAGTPLADIDDPIMGGKDIEEGRPARKLVRDPDGLVDHMVKGANLTMDPAKGGESKGAPLGEKDGDTKESGGDKSKGSPLGEGDKGSVDLKPSSSQETKLKQANQQGGAKAVIDSISTTASYEETGKEVVVVSDDSDSPSPSIQEESGESLVSVGGGKGKGDDPYEGLYKGG